MPETLGHYELLERLGAGALGEVFRARDTRVGRTVAIKRVPAALASDPGLRSKIERAARDAAALSHPHLASLYELGDDQGQLFLVCEHVTGEGLDTVMAGQAMNARRAVEIAVQLADALAEAHAAGILHRDVAPRNVVITARGQTKLLDMGLGAFTAGGALRARAPALLEGDNGAALQPLRYLSPEEALGEPADHRSDIFSLGAILYEMLTGSPAFDARDAAGTIVAVAQATPPPPSVRNPAVPSELDAVVARALAKSLDRRYQSAAEMAAALRGVLERVEAGAAGLPVESLPQPMPQPSEVRGGRRALLLLALVTVVLALLAWLFGDQFWTAGGV